MRAAAWSHVADHRCLVGHLGNGPLAAAPVVRLWAGQSKRTASGLWMRRSNRKPMLSRRGRPDGLLGRSPGCENLEPFSAGRAGLGGVDHQDRTRFGSDGKFFVGQGQFADDGMVEPFRPGTMGADIVCRP